MSANSLTRLTSESSLVHGNNVSYFSNTTTPISAQNGAVSSGNAHCNILGVEVLKDGGNAVDASITTALCLGVENMFASGVGGGGIMLIKNKTDHFTIDCREVAPASATPDMFVEEPEKSKFGGLAVGVPGEFMCLDYAFRNHGSGAVTWKRLFDPIINMTRNGFVVNELLSIRLESYKDLIMKDEGLRSVWTTNGVLKKKGDTVVMKNLANTLETVATKGIKEFYDGSLTQTMVDEINANGGDFTYEDFSSYEIKTPGTYNSTYKNHTVVTPKLPFSGGLMLIQSLNMLERFYLERRPYDTNAIHLLIEVMKFAFSNRLVLGDPDSTNMTLVEPAMLSKRYAETLTRRIHVNRTFPPTYYLDLAKGESSIASPRGHGTEHLSVVDSDRNAVAFTTSVNLGWGAGFIGLETGILYNNQMDDFHSPPKNKTELPSYPANYPGPNKRPLSSMTPTLIYDHEGKLVLVTGGSGGPRIFTGTLLNIVLLLDYKYNLKQATLFPRYHHQLEPNHVLAEEALPQKTVENLISRGHKVRSFRNSL